MSKSRKRILSLAEQTSAKRIKTDEKKGVLSNLLRFSFKFYEPNHPEFNCGGRGAEYFNTFLGRLKDLSTLQVTELIQAKTNRTTRFHRIDFTEGRVQASGFGIRQWEDFDEEAWQFSLGVNESGRVHGFLIGDIFYIVWLDANHKLYQ